MPKFLIDESSGRKLFNFLKQNNYDVLFVADILHGAADVQILEFAQKEKRIIITNDKDFGELIFRFKLPSHGVILLRIKEDFPEIRQQFVITMLKQFADKLEKQFIVITESRVRIRKI
ncbi:MAG: DUF5615 family PIN-like protein [archaeon]|nr:DUF5615 family PIN-like protein [archaeon]